MTAGPRFTKFSQGRIRCSVQEQLRTRPTSADYGNTPAFNFPTSNITTNSVRFADVFVRVSRGKSEGYDVMTGGKERTHTPLLHAVHTSPVHLNVLRSNHE